MKRPLALAAAATALTLPLTACGGPSQDSTPQYQGVCMSQDGQTRVDDDYCDPDDDDYAGPGWAMWAFLAMNSRVPAVGSSLSGHRYTTVAPTTPYVLGGAPVRGGQVTPSTLAAASRTSPSIKNPSSTATPKPSTTAPAKPQASATPKPAAPSAAAPAAPAAPKASKKPWWTGMSGKACGKMSRSSGGGSKSYSSGGGSKSWGSSGSKSTSRDTPKSSSGSSSSKKSSTC